MKPTRLEAFSDAIIAIIITIMVLELKIPHEPHWEALWHDMPTFLAYALSFLFLGAYWVNHHHMIMNAPRVSDKLLWLNLLSMFCLSLIPFGTAWVGEQFNEGVPTTVYCAILLAAALSYNLLQREVVVLAGGKNSALGKAIGRDWKAAATIGIYALGALAAPWLPLLGYVLSTAVVLIWFIPDRRLSKALNDGAASVNAEEAR